MGSAQLLTTGRVPGRHAARRRVRDAILRSCAGLLGSLALAGCAGCAGGAGGVAAAPSPAPTGLPEGVTVEVVQLRADVAVRQAQVHLVNGSDEPLEIGDVTVEDARFAAPATRVIAGRTSILPAGGELDVRVQLPEVSCASASAAADEGPVVELEILAGGESTTLSVPADDPLGFLAPLHERECRAEALAGAAELSFTAFTPSAPGEPATLQLTIAPTGEGRAAVAAVQATNLLSFGPATVDGAFPVDVEVTPDATVSVVDIPVLPTRCDPHAVQEDKRGTIFDVRLELDGEPGEIELFVGEEMRGRILTWVASWCGFGA